MRDIDSNLDQLGDESPLAKTQFSSALWIGYLSRGVENKIHTIQNIYYGVDITLYLAVISSFNTLLGKNCIIVQERIRGPQVVNNTRANSPTSAS